MLASIFLSLFFFQVPAVTPSAVSTPPPVSAPEAKEEPPEVRRHSLVVGGKTLNYTTTTGHMPIRNAQTGVVELGSSTWHTRSTASPIRRDVR
ncbi:MAG TPA: hypothetical protein PKO33_06900 [Pyrinomonadaceae bacterium]|nr:hypothetical protein [Pyrinomonadaceae bacterium]